MENLLEQSNEIISQLRAENKVLRNDLSKLREQVAWFQRQIFGQKKETFVAGESTPLIPGLDLPEAETVEEPVVEKKAVVVRKKRKKFKQFEFPENAPREEEIVDIPEEEKKGLMYIGEDVTERLAIRRARFFVKVTKIKKYIVTGDPQLGIHTAKSWSPAIPGSRVDESLLAEILVNKYANHLPLYRICQMFEREGLVIPRQTLSKLVIKAGTLLAPLGELLELEIMNCGRVFTDDSPVQLQVKGKDKTQTARIWIHVGGDGPDPPLVFYSFSENRREEHPLGQFKNFKGSLQSDAYGAYEKVAACPGVVWQPCWVHARRKFYDSQTTHPLKEQVVVLTDKLFEHEQEAWKLDDGIGKSKARIDYRNRYCRPLVNDIFCTVKDAVRNSTLMPKMKLTEAVGYLLSRESYFRNFLSHSELRIDNNVAERNIRPLAIGRKNWLFVGSKDGGKAAATLLSLIQTCKNLDVNPAEYLTDVLRQINNTDVEKLPKLLPQNWKKTGSENV